MDRPNDQCPYPKPFPPEFRDCPAFQSRQFIPLDTLYQPLEPVLTCRHLQTRALPQRYRWYAACALGDAEGRRRWVRELGVMRLERIRALQRNMAEVMSPYTPRLWTLKGQQLRAVRDSRDASPITEQLREVAAQATAALDAFLTDRSDTLAEIELPIDAVRKLILLALDRFIEPQLSSEISIEVPDDILERFPDSVRIFFRPPPRPTETSVV
ncbi:MAG TPA: hypothetical protein VIT43_05320 [Candidatus Dormibacteraeota bacterium]